MSTREDEVRKLVDEMTKPALHSSICKCPMCMRGDKIPLAQQTKHEHGLKSTMVDRRNPDDPVRPLMKATEAHAIIQAGTKVDMGKVIGAACRQFLRNQPGHPSPRQGQKQATSMPPAALAVLVPLDFDPPSGLKIYAPQ